MLNTSHEFTKLSNKEFIVLEMLANNPEMFGLEMVEASKGQLKRGTIYVTLMRMAEKGYVESHEENRPVPEIGIPRRMYRATGLGQTIYLTNLKATKIFSDLILGGIS